MKMILHHFYILLFICICFQIILITEAYSFEITIIVNPDVNESISANDIRNIFLGKKTQWNNNQRIRFVLLTEKKIYRNFLAKYVGKTLYQYRNYWRKKVFTGTGMMPIMFKDTSQSIEFVRRTKGAISFVPKTKNIADDIKELIVNP
ncbi:phosphate ABC transporter substrate-binding protein [Candidatus Magnetomorum sp. HK-1]|nr:phosphate ABC transporter substrate-binding protein [Candidatus Magnetomorum sp. HK-1]